MDCSQEERLLVLGGTGNVGQYVVQWLKEQNAPAVKILVGTRSPQAVAGDNTVEGVSCDLSDPASIKAAVRGSQPHRVFLCLPQALDEHAMRISSEACAEAMLEVGASRLVRVASVGIDGDGVVQGPLGAAHVAAEAHVKSLGLKLTSIRPTSFHTNFLKYDVESIRTESRFRSPLGTEARVNWVHCRDIGYVSATLLAKKEAIQRGDEVVEVTGPPSSTLSAPQMAKLLSEELGREVSYEEVDPPPVPAYQSLWKFLRNGGFDTSTEEVARVTGRSPIDFVDLVRELKPQLCSEGSS
mmetsp:Transcript_22275/g.48969  ORF Transcript_22275/g.48969 Transcript_22275/m.48969 type:complete len:298 (-) Transcript_22275:19-912(-)